MTQLICGCGNSRRWRNVTTGPAGTRADCGTCGTHHNRRDVVSSFQIQVAQTDSMTLGSGLTETNRF